MTQVSGGQLATVDITVNYTLLAYMLFYHCINSAIIGAFTFNSGSGRMFKISRIKTEIFSL